MSQLSDLKLLHDESERENEESTTPLEYDISVYPADYTLEVLYQKWNSGDIVLPPFQREFVWTSVQASRLIESFFMGLPIPPIFFYLDQDQKYLVIDGRQRLETIFSYMDGCFKQSDGRPKKPFKLTGINEQSRIFGKTFNELEEGDKLKLKNSVLRSIIIKQINPANTISVYHIFERLNTGGTILRDQEIRNCVYSGKFNDLLIKLNGDENWRKILGKPTKDSRQKDVQLILRYMALLNDSKTYKKPMRDFLSSFMDRHKNDDEKFMDQQGNLFVKTCGTIIHNLGSKPFNPKNVLNASFFDSVFVAFAKHVDDIPSDIKDRFEKLLKMKDFLSLTNTHTTDVMIVQSRLKKAESVLFG